MNGGTPAVAPRGRTPAPRPSVVSEFGPRFRLRTMLALLALAAALPLAIFATWLVVRSGANQKAVIGARNVETARAIRIAVDQRIRSAIAALKVLQEHETIREDRIPAFEEFASRVLQSQTNWKSVLVLDHEGRTLANTDDTFGEAATRPDWYTRIKATREPALSGLRRDPETKEAFIEVGLPILRSGELKYILAARILASNLSTLLAAQNLPPNAIATLIDADGVVVARTRNEAAIIGEPATATFREASRAMTEGTWNEVEEEGGSAYAALSRSDLSGWTVGLTLSREFIDGPMRRSLFALIAVGGALFALGAALAFTVSRTLVTALRGTSATAIDLAAGRRVEPEPSSIVEIDALAKSIGTAAMILALREVERDQAEQARARAAAALEQALLAERRARLVSEQTEARLAVTLDSIGDAVIATDREQRVTVINPAACALTGWSADEAAGRPVGEVLDLRDDRTGRPGVNLVEQALSADGPVHVVEHLVLKTSDGRSIPIEDSAAPIRGADGEPIGAILVLRDVTERREAEEQRRRLLQNEREARRQAEEANRGKDEFVATVSHELRTPLNAISGWVQLLRTGRLGPAEQQKAVEVIERNAWLQAQLIEDLLDVSRIVRGGLTLEYRPVEIAAVIAAAAESARPTAADRGIEICLELAPGKAVVEGDARRLQQVVWNLLANSMKFTPRGGRIDVRLSWEPSGAVIEVRDTGIGISAEFLPHVFERFRQGDGATSRRHGGLGIGLSLARHLVELHGGSITAESPGEDMGATFTVRLPALGREATAPALPGSDPPAAENAPEGQLAGLSVLAVDDDQDAREFLARALSAAGAKVRTAESGREALDLVAAERPDVVVSDVAMPGMPGHELAARIRAMPGMRRLPLVAVTAFTGQAHERAALKAGYDRHLGKPVHASRLVMTVRELARR